MIIVIFASHTNQKTAKEPTLQINLVRQMKNVLLILLIFNLHAAGQQRPNIVVVIADDHTMQAIGAYGARYGVSPNIDQLAKEGVLFNRAFVTNSICAPSRAVLVTGQFSHKNGHINNLTKFDGSQDQYQKRNNYHQNLIPYLL